MSEAKAVRFFKNDDFVAWSIPFRIADTYDVEGAYPIPEDSGWVTRPQVFFVSRGEFEYKAMDEVYFVTSATPVRKWGTIGAASFVCVSDEGEAICFTPVGMDKQWDSDRISLSGGESRTIEGDISRQYLYICDGVVSMSGSPVYDRVIYIGEAEDISLKCESENARLVLMHSPRVFDMEYSESRPPEISEPIR